MSFGRYGPRDLGDLRVVVVYAAPEDHIGNGIWGIYSTLANARRELAAAGLREWDPDDAGRTVPRAADERVVGSMGLDVRRVRPPALDIDRLARALTSPTVSQWFRGLFREWPEGAHLALDRAYDIAHALVEAYENER